MQIQFSHQAQSDLEDIFAYGLRHWGDERAEAVPRYAYMPFGGGPRICIGNSFAMMEAQLILASIVQQYHLSHVERHEVVPEPLVTLRPKHGMKMRLHKR